MWTDLQMLLGILGGCIFGAMAGLLIVGVFAANHIHELEQGIYYWRGVAERRHSPRPSTGSESGCGLKG
jgi:hypothetical protein